MIELKHDQLEFTFPHIEEELRKRTESYVEAQLPQVLAEDRESALEQLLSRYRRTYSNRRLSDGFSKRLETLRRKILAMTDDEVAKTFRSAVLSEAGLSSGPKGLSIECQRTLRIPDDGKDYPLPPGLGQFPLRHLDDYATRVPETWRRRGGVLMPMYQAEALWLNFHSNYPFALKVGAGKINAITGENWRSGLHRDPQDYVVLPEQPWLDGFAVERGVIRQFVAMPLGSGYSVEEQLTGKAEYGGLQFQAYPMKASVHFEREILPRLPKGFQAVLSRIIPMGFFYDPQTLNAPDVEFCCVADSSMGLGAGGRMRQEVYTDPHDLDCWDMDRSSRCFVHLCNAPVWKAITGSCPPHAPVTAQDYERCGLPWFDYYRTDLDALEGSPKLSSVRSVEDLAFVEGDYSILENGSVATGQPVNCGPDPRPRQVREAALREPGSEIQ